jgi:hypothetical protein
MWDIVSSETLLARQNIDAPFRCLVDFLGRQEIGGVGDFPEIFGQIFLP